MEDNNIVENFNGKCKEQNHQKFELLYFCKSHNVLCCEGCISKEEEEGKGQHKNCDVCHIEIIKEEKEKNSKENINNLEKNLSYFKDSLIELNKIIDKKNEEKEMIKIKIQRLFTKIRNELNKREDELYLQVDKNYEVYENINYKERAKLYKIAIKNLEKGKETENNWNNDKKLNFLINNCINIEKNIKDIHIIQEKINKLMEESEKEKDFYQNKDFEEFTKSFENIGIIETKENYLKKTEEHFLLEFGELIKIMKYFIE